MKLKVWPVFLLLICRVCLQEVDGSLPDFTPASPRLQVQVSESTVISSVNRKKEVSRLPGLCRRLKRRRVTVMCNREKFCWRGRIEKPRPLQVCLCPRGSRCSHFFVHSL